MSQEWEVWCHAIGKWDYESVIMLFCASKGDEIEGWKEREERRCVRQKIPYQFVHRSARAAWTYVGCSA